MIVGLYSTLRTTWASPMTMQVGANVRRKHAHGGGVAVSYLGYEAPQNIRGDGYRLRRAGINSRWILGTVSMRREGRLRATRTLPSRPLRRSTTAGIALTKVGGVSSMISSSLAHGLRRPGRLRFAAKGHAWVSATDVAGHGQGMGDDGR